MMPIQIVISMKNLYIFFLISFGLNFSQNNIGPVDKKGYDLYIVYEELDKIFTKPIDTTDENLHYSVYTLRIPNQNNPRFVFNFKDKDSLELGYTLKGGNGTDFDFNFSHNSKEHEKFYIEKNKHLENQISINHILASNLKVFERVLEKANIIYILEVVDEESFEYIAREVSYSKDIKL
ncbi:MAG TPA: hypothetical protein VFM70_02995 [Salinimicrobium sp.]|nr:hypothetical protein [Salinimicrobium sp.]